MAYLTSLKETYSGLFMNLATVLEFEWVLGYANPRVGFRKHLGELGCQPAGSEE